MGRRVEPEMLPESNGSEPQGVRLGESFIIAELDARISGLVRENIQQGAYIRQLESQIITLNEAVSASMNQVKETVDVIEPG